MNKKIVETKRSNYRMFKKGKIWVFACAITMSMMGVLAFTTNDVHAATGDTPTTQVATAVSTDTTKDATTESSKSASATSTDETTATSSDATPLSDQASTATSTTATEPASNVEETTVDETAAPASDATSQAAMPATETTQADQTVDSTETSSAAVTSPASTATSSATDVSQADNTQTSDAVSSDVTATSSAAVSTTDTEETPVSDSTTPDTINDVTTSETDAVSDANLATAEESVTDATKTSMLADVVATDKVAQAAAADAGSGLGAIFASGGTLTTGGTAYTGLTETNGKYSGTLTAHFVSTSIGLNTETTDFVLTIPKQLQPLVASAGFKQYITGKFHVPAFKILGFGPDEINQTYTAADIDIASDGSSITFSNVTSDTLGLRTITEDITLDIGAAVNATGIKIADADDNYTFGGAIVEPGSITDWIIFAENTKNAPIGTNQLMPGEVTGVAKPYVNQPVYDTSTSISGTGTAGATVYVYSSDGSNLLGSAIVNSSGFYAVNIPAQAKGTQILVEQATSAGTSDPTAVTIQHVAINIGAPIINQPYAGDTTVAGKMGTNGTPGDLIVVTDNSGKQLGSGYVAADGSYTVSLTRALVETDTVRVQEANNSDLSDVATMQVNPQKVVDVAAPTVDDIYDDSTTITGTSTEKTVTITTVGGQEIGTATVINGRYTIPLTSTLPAGLQVVATAYDADGNPSDRVNATVQTSVDTPTIDDVYAGADTITGSANASRVSITNGNGDLIGSANVVNGKYSVAVKTFLNAGDKLYATAYDANNNASDKASTTVLQQKVNAPTINDVHAGDTTITGTSDAATVAITEGDFLIGRANVVDGKYTINVVANLQQGEKLTAYAQDANGNSSDPTETTVLAKTVDAPVVNAMHEGDSTITGTSTADTVSVFQNGNLVGTANVVNGAYTIDVLANLKAGTQLVAVASDANGNKSANVDFTVLPAEVNVNVPSFDDLYAGGTQITGTSDETTVSVYENGKFVDTVDVVDGKFAIDVLAPLKEGVQITATAQDANGNSSGQAETTVLPAKVTVDVPTLDDLYAGGKQITGTSDEATVTVYENGQFVDTVDVVDGKFTVNVLAPLKEGTQVTAVAQDANGNTSEQAETTVLPEQVTINAPKFDDLYDGGTQITGTSDAATVTVYEDGKFVDTVDVADGKFSIDLLNPLKEGTKVTAVAQDANGNTSEQAETTVLPVVVAVNVPKLDDLYAGGKQITGTSDAATVTVYEDGKFVDTVDVADGKFTVDVLAPLKEGTQVTAVAQDANGNTSEQAETTVLPEQATVNAPKFDDLYAGGTQITGTSDATTVTIYEDGKFVDTVDVTNGKFSVDVFAALKEGTKLTAVAQDANGNTSEQAETTVLPAKATVDAPVFDDLYAGGAQITGTSDESTVTVYENGQFVDTVDVVNGKFTVNVFSPLREGTTVTAVAQNDDGKTSEQASTTVLPAKEPVTTPVFADVHAGDTTITGTSGGTTVTISKDGTEIGTADVVDGKFTFDVGSINLAEGDELEAIAKDSDGTQSEQGTTLVLAASTEVTPPTLQPVYAGDTTINGTGQAGATVTVSIRQLGKVSSIGTAEVGGDGKFTVNVPSGITLNSYDIINVEQTFEGNPAGETEIAVHY